MSTKSHLRARFKPVTYRPTPEEIAEKTAVFRKRKLNQNREEFDKREYDKQREMTKADICNVEWASLEDVYEALGMVPDDDSSWTTVDGKVVL